ncbi:T9SS type A sorting domain-containing protein [Vaginella massiliensis]|uniref:T9SS type A sorting domain-containing protein n=1 Tax=Vaginella massiliensis TaxID=1816680 RepID=UPI003752E82B
MKKFFTLLLLLPLALKAQKFEEVNTNLSNFYYSSCDTGDIDGDGFLDLVHNGAVDSDNNGSVDTTKNFVYKNNNGNFSQFYDFGQNATHLGGIKFIDFDNDGLLDIVSTGLSYMDVVNYQQYLYRNTGNGFEFVENIPGKVYSSIEVFDFNHDGKQDFAINGVQYLDKDGFVYNLDLFTNKGNGFDQTFGWLPGTQNGSFKIMDLNNDKLLDAVVFGFDEETEATFTIYINNQGTLEASQTLSGVANGKVAYADFNADGFLDLVVTGVDANYYLYLAVLWNDGNGNFTITVIENEGLGQSSIQTGDLNNDGYYDFVLIGDDKFFDGSVKIFTYDPSTNSFTKAKDTGLYNLGGTGHITLFDYDNDNQLDILMSGFAWEEENYPALAKLYKNISTEKNLPPSPPTDLQLNKTDNKYSFSWSGATDDKTPTKALKYELKVGTSSGAGDIAKYVVTTPYWFLELDEAYENLYWSVKTIDASNAYSESSKEENLGLISNQKEVIKVYPNPASDKIHIHAENIEAVALYDLKGAEINVKIKNGIINIAHLEKGIYILKIYSDGKFYTEKIIKE